MAAQIYTFKITYENCDNRIWRTAEVSSNYTLAKLGYLILASFDTLAYHLFEITFREDRYVLPFEDCLEDFADGAYLLDWWKLSKFNIQIGEHMEMVYDFGCEQVFDIELLAVRDLEPHHGKAYPKIVDGAGRGIVDDLPAQELLEVIRRIDGGKTSGIYYNEEKQEWDYRYFTVGNNNILTRAGLPFIQEGYETYE